MESTSTITKFILICNYVGHIISPIKSRCVCFHFKTIQVKDIFSKLRFISQKESIAISDSGINAICKLCEGDVRRAIVILQKTKYIGKLLKAQINKSDVYSISSFVSVDDIVEFWEPIFAPKTDMTILKLSENTHSLIKKGFAIDYLLAAFHELICSETRLDSIQKAYASEYLAKIERHILEGGSEYIQLLGLIVFIFNVKNYKVDYDMFVGIF